MNVDKERAAAALKAIRQAAGAPKNFPASNGGLRPRGRWDSRNPMLTLIHPGALPDVPTHPVLLSKTLKHETSIPAKQTDESPYLYSIHAPAPDGD